MLKKINNNLYFLPFFILVAYVLFFSVNYPIWDEWEFIERLRLLKLKELNFLDILFSKHVDHLIGVGFLIQIFILDLTKYNQIIINSLSTLIQFSTFIIFLKYIKINSMVHIHKSHYLLIALTVFSLSTYQNYLWAFQTPWFLISLLLFLNTYLVHNFLLLEKTKYIVASAILCCIASFLCTQGFFLWLISLFHIFSYYLITKKNINKLHYGFLLFFIFFMFIYIYLWFSKGIFIHQNKEDFSLKNFVINYFGILGNTSLSPNKNFKIFIGFLISIFYLYSIIFYFSIYFNIVRIKSNNQIIFLGSLISLILFNIIFVVSVAYGRSMFGTAAIHDSHYTSYNFVGLCSVLVFLINFEKSVKLKQIFFITISCVYLLALYPAIKSGMISQLRNLSSQHVLLNIDKYDENIIGGKIFPDIELVKRSNEFLKKKGYSIYSFKNHKDKLKDVHSHLANTFSNIPDHCSEDFNTLWNIYIHAEDVQFSYNLLNHSDLKNYIAWVRKTFGNENSSYYLRNKFNLKYNDCMEILSNSVTD